MKKNLFALPVILLVAAGCNSSTTSRQTNQTQVTPITQQTANQAQTDNSNLDITTTELANFFNAKFKCPASKPCFNSQFQSTNVMGVYDNPFFKVVDFTGDNHTDALVAIYYSGSGAFRDFFALTKDSTITKNNSGEIQTVYQKPGVGFSKSSPAWSDSNNNYLLVCPDADRNGQPDCEVTISWNANKQTFIEKEQAVVSNIFTYKAKQGDKVGGMVLEQIQGNVDSKSPADADHIYAVFTGTITLRGKLAAPTENPEDAGMGPQYSLNDLIQDSLKKLPYLQSDTRTVWFGVKNQDIMKNFPVKNGDLVDMTINKYEYVFFPAGVWNQANVVDVKKVQ